MSHAEPSADDVPVEELAPGVFMYGNPPPEMEAAMRAVAPKVAARKARADTEALKASAPCQGCGRDMPQSERCMKCVESGSWYCPSCHVRLEAKTGIGPSF